MYIVFIVLILIASLLIVLTVLAQSPKSGMAANFGASNQVMGVRETTNFLEKFTWGLAIAILVLSIGATMFMPKSRIEASKSAIQRETQQNLGGNETLRPDQLGVPSTSQQEAAGTQSTEQSGETTTENQQ